MTRDSIQQTRATQAALTEDNDDPDPCFNDLEEIQDLKEPIKFDSYMGNPNQYKKDFAT